MALTILLIGIISSSLIFVISIFCYKQSNSKLKINNHQLPPGKMGLPFLGESVEFLSCVVKGEAENFVYNRISKYSSRVFKTKLLGEEVIVMHGAAENKFLFANTNKVVAEWWPKHVGKLVGVGNTSIKLRDLLPPFVSSVALYRHVPVMDSVIQRYLQDNWVGKHKVLAVPSIKYCNLALACRIFLSIEDEDLISKFMAQTEAVVKGFASLPFNLPWTQFGKAMKASRELKSLMRPVIRDRKANLLSLNGINNENQDLLTNALLLSMNKQQTIGEDQIADMAIEILVGAHESSGMISLILSRLIIMTSTLVYYMIMEVAGSKTTGKLLSMDDIRRLKYLSNVTCEVLRLHTPAVFAFRQVISDFTYDSFRIPRGWKILLNITAIHKDPEYFPLPEKFDPSRFEGNGPLPFTFTPFGGGSLLCPGKNYSQLFTSVFMYNVVKLFRWTKIIQDENIIHEPGPVPAQGLPLLLNLSSH